MRGLEAELGAGGRAEVVRFDNHGARVEVVGSATGRAVEVK